MARSPLRWIQQQLFVRGIEIRKFPTAEFRPLRVFDLAAQAIMAARGEPLRFVQVGANDGSFVDPIRPYIVECGWRGILIEPQPDVFEKLVSNYADYKEQLAFENVAISSGESLILYLPPADLDGTDRAIHARSVVSADRRVIARQLGVGTNELRQIEVPSITLDALFRTIQEITGTSVTVRDFRVHSVTRGTDAQGESTIEVERNGRVYRGRGVSTDTVEAATLAFLNAVNRAEAGVGQPAQPTPHDVV